MSAEETRREAMRELTRLGEEMYVYELLFEARQLAKANSDDQMMGLLEQILREVQAKDKGEEQ